MRISVAHEWLTNWAGSERVVEHLVRLTAPSELVASVVDPGFARKHFPTVPVRPLWPSRLPGAQTHWSRYALPMIAAWATTKIESDALIVSSHFAAHGATVRFDGPSIVYYHTPARMAWRPDIELERLSPRVRGVIEKVGLPTLRRWDRGIGQRPTVVLANSTAVARRIRDAYSRPAEVLHPPVDVHRWRSVERKEPRHLLWLGRLVAYKRPWVAVEAARRSGAPLVVVGDGPERASLERTAPANVRFVGHASDSVVRDALAHAIGLVFPGEEDFGIAPVESLAAGVPVIAYAAGGALDYIEHGVNGLLVGNHDPATFADAMTVCRRTDWDVEQVRDSAIPFSPKIFERRLVSILAGALGPAWTRSRKDI